MLYSPIYDISFDSSLEQLYHDIHFRNANSNVVNFPPTLS